MSRGAIVFGDEVRKDTLPDSGGVPPRMPPGGDDGNEPPFWGLPEDRRVNSAQVGMLIFLGSETMLFAGFVTAYLVFRLGAPVWPPPFQPRLPVEVTAVNTAVLLLSGYTMWQALRAARRGNQSGLLRSLALTALLGGTFLGVQGYEGARLLAFGLTASSGIYGGTFYTVVGAHAVHVLGALAWLSIILIGTRRGRYTAQDHAGLSVFRLYWYFVVALWPILYALVYLA